MKKHPKDQNPRLHGFETGRSRRRNPAGKGPKKAGRVSQRRELAVVTLGAVAAITGLGGFLAANPLNWATTSENAAPETVAVAEADPGGTAPGDEVPQPREPAPIQVQEEAPEMPAEQAPPGPPPGPPVSSQATVENAPPAWSAPAQAPAATESRGS